MSDVFAPHSPGRSRMSLPAGYTTSNVTSGSSRTTNLYYNGTLVAALSSNMSTKQVTLSDYTTNRHWTSTSGVGLVAGQTWNLASNASGTANSTGSELKGVCAGATGYFYYATDSNGDYYSEHYHPTFYSSAQRINTTIRSGGGNVCPPSGCPLSPASSFQCVTDIVGLGFGAVGMAASAAGLLTGVLTPLAIGGLIASHIVFLWSVASIYADCM